MPSIEFEGRAVPVGPDDTVAAALYRSGVRILSRSFKYHRPRGLYCLSGDCANCLITVDGEPAVRACVTPAVPGQRVERARGWPSADHDALAVLWRCRALLPVGFYYKTFVRPRWVWPLAERVIRRLAGIGPVPSGARALRRECCHHHPDVLIAGGGIAGLSAALACVDRGESVVLADEGTIGEKVPPSAARSAIDRLWATAQAAPGVTVLERTRVAGVYEGPMVAAAGPRLTHWVHPRRIVVATGAVERHAVFPGNDLPGVWLGRGASRLAGVHGLALGRVAVVLAETAEAFEHIAVLRRSGVIVRHVIAPPALAALVPADIEVSIGGRVAEARGRRRLTAVVLDGPRGQRVIQCDALVMATPLVPRDGLLRQASGVIIDGAGDVVEPGCTIDRAMASGREAAGHATTSPVTAAPPPASTPAAPIPTPTAGFVCPCEDVEAGDLAAAWAEGFRWTELLKRYTTATMGPCQGQLCHVHLRAFAAARSPSAQADAPMTAATTARPPARAITVAEAAAGVEHAVEQRTALHERHLALGARMEWAGPWKRPASYGDVDAEYWAVRRAVGIMDVGTLGKYRVCGPDALEFLERLYPISVRGIPIGRSRYGLLLNDAGFIFDDGLVAAVAPNEYFVSVTSGGADAAEAWMRDWAETWRLRVHIVNQTAALGAINVTGPLARALLARLTEDDIDPATLARSGVRRITVAGVPCLALRVGFTGEVSFELHHPRAQGGELWDALLRAGAELGIRPHGLDAVKLLRLEKGHVIVSQDTDFDTTPAKIGLGAMVRMDKPYFVGRSELRRLAMLPVQRRLVGLRFAGRRAPDEGAQLTAGRERVGYLTSSRYSPVLDCGVALGWLAESAAAPSATVVAVSRGRRRSAGHVVSGPFYDPLGLRLRA